MVVGASYSHTDMLKLDTMLVQLGLEQFVTDAVVDIRLDRRLASVPLPLRQPHPISAKSTLLLNSYTVSQHHLDGSYRTMRHTTILIGILMTTTMTRRRKMSTATWQMMAMSLAFQAYLV
jgi:hypothetical protein